MQDEKWALGKSKCMFSLLKHTATYTLMWVPFTLLFLPGFPGFDFLCITFICHTITDYVTSRITSKLYAKGKFGSSIPNLGFFTMIGFDQYLHYLQLFLTYWYLTK